MEIRTDVILEMDTNMAYTTDLRTTLVPDPHLT